MTKSIVLLSVFLMLTFQSAAGQTSEFQKPDGRLVFRTGIGFPETTYLSLGISF